MLGVLYLVEFNHFDLTMGFYWSYTLLLELSVLMRSWYICRAQQRLVERDVAPVAVLQSWPREHQMYVTVLVPGGPPASLAHVIFIC